MGGSRLGRMAAVLRLRGVTTTVSRLGGRAAAVSRLRGMAAAISRLGGVTTAVSRLWGVATAISRLGGGRAVSSLLLVLLAGARVCLLVARGAVALGLLVLRLSVAVLRGLCMRIVGLGSCEQRFAKAT